MASAFTQLSPSAFASLSFDEQRAYQIRQANDINDRLMNRDDTVTQSEVDFAARVLNKNIGSVPSTSLWDNLVQGASETASGIGFGQFKLLWPVLLLGLVLIGVFLAFNKAKH